MVVCGVPSMSAVVVKMDVYTKSRFSNTIAAMVKMNDACWAKDVYGLRRPPDKFIDEKCMRFLLTCNIIVNKNYLLCCQYVSGVISLAFVNFRLFVRLFDCSLLFTVSVRARLF